MTEDNSHMGEKVVELLVENGYGPEEELRGCSEEELEELEKDLEITLPEAYKSFMKVTGKYAGGFLKGHEYYYPVVKVQNEQARDGAERKEKESIFDDSDFVFVGLQGYSYWFFNTENGSDPPVFHYIEGDDESTKKAESFSEWIYSEIEN